MSQSEKFAELAEGVATWAVSAIHGERDRLEALHAALADRIGLTDNLIYLGNWMGYGPDVAGTIDSMLLFRRRLMARPGAEKMTVAFLRGAQEEMWYKLLQIQFAGSPTEVLTWMLDHGMAATLAAYGSNGKAGLFAAREGVGALTQWTGQLRQAMRGHPGHDALMSALKRAAFAPTRKTIFVAAGVDRALPLEQQTDGFWWGGSDFDAILEPWSGFDRLIRGYDPTHGGFRKNHTTVTLDGGCGFGGPLMAGRFDAAGNMTDRIKI